MNNLFVILKAILGTLFTGVKSTWQSVKKAVSYGANAVRTYVTADDTERQTLISAHRSDAKSAAISIALVAGTAFVISGICTFIGGYFQFIPAVIRRAIGYLVIMLGTEKVATSIENIGVQNDITCKAQVIVAVLMNAFVPYMFLRVVFDMTDKNGWALISCYIAVGVYKLIKNPPVKAEAEEDAEIA